MKYYSELTKKFYDTEDDCKAAENTELKKNSERKVDAEAVEKAYEAYKTAGDEYHKVLTDFCKKHGPYHKTYTLNNVKDGLADWIRMIDLL